MTLQAIATMTLLLLGGGIALYLLVSFYKLTVQVDELTRKLNSQGECLVEVDRDTKVIGNAGKEYEALVKKLTGAIDQVALIQDKQALEIKKVKRRDNWQSHLGLDARNPDIIPVSKVDTITLVEGPYMPTSVDS